MVVFILNTATESGWLSPWDPPLPWGKVRKRIYRPATHPIHFAAVSPDKIHRYAAWAVFFFYGKRTLKISWADRTWYRLFVNAAAQTGAGTAFGANGDPITWAAELSTYFCVLTIRKHLLNLSGLGPSICYRRPFCRLKAPLGLSLLRCASQTRSHPKPCSWFAPDGANSNGVSCFT